MEGDPVLAALIVLVGSIWVLNFVLAVVWWRELKRRRQWRKPMKQI